MSVVYRARDIRLNRPVAIKVLPPELAYDSAIRLRFTREAQTSAQLPTRHRSDLRRRRAIWSRFVMAHVTGGNLATLLGRAPRPPIEDARRIIREIADALEYAPTSAALFTATSSPTTSCSTATVVARSSPTSASREPSRRAAGSR